MYIIKCKYMINYHKYKSEILAILYNAKVKFFMYNIIKNIIN